MSEKYWTSAIVVGGELSPAILLCALSGQQDTRYDQGVLAQVIGKSTPNRLKISAVYSLGAVSIYPPADLLLLMQQEVTTEGISMNRLEITSVFQRRVYLL